MPVDVVLMADISNTVNIVTDTMTASSPQLLPHISNRSGMCRLRDTHTLQLFSLQSGDS
jgi:hypothetical protein